MAGCQSSPPQATDRPYVQQIAGSLATFDMTPVPGRAGVAPFWISRTEVTWDAYDIWLFGRDTGESGGADAESRPSKPYNPPDRGWGHEGYPAIAVSHKAATLYCQWLSSTTGRKHRLPTEAEWEHACRAGGFEPLRPGRTQLDKIAWHAGNSKDKTQPVAAKQPNALGLCDMLGNVAEWCVGADGKPVVRGGSFLDDPADVHCRARRQPDESWRATDPQVPKSKWWLSDAPFVGFRVVCER